MARKYAQIQCSIWSDESFKGLTAAEQHMYFVLLSQPRINMCGLLDYLPSRLAICVDEWTADDVEQLVKRLDAKRYVVVDYDSHELLLRSFVRNDGLLRMPNPTKGMATDYAEIMSDKLRKAVDKELQRAYSEEPDLAGWRGLKEANPVLHRNVTGGVSK